MTPEQRVDKVYNIVIGALLVASAFAVKVLWDTRKDETKGKHR